MMVGREADAWEAETWEASWRALAMMEGSWSNLERALARRSGVNWLGVREVPALRRWRRAALSGWSWAMGMMS
jgi:hypothetical protein